MLTHIIFASLIEMSVAFVGVLFFLRSTDKLLKHTHILLSVAVGAFLGVVFFDLLPESIEMAGDSAFLFVLLGFLLFFILSRTLTWYHHHHSDEEYTHNDNHGKPRATMVLAGDALHNFIDGALIAFAFMANPALGVATTLAVLIHEFPQELADFFVLLSSGFSKKRALALNFLASVPTLIGALLAYFLGTHIEGLLGPALAITAGNFIYLAASDILPELSHNHGTSAKKTFRQILAVLLGIAAIWGTLKISGHHHAVEGEHGHEHGHEEEHEEETAHEEEHHE